MSTKRLLFAVLSFVFFLALASTCVAVPEEGAHAASAPPREPPNSLRSSKGGTDETWDGTAADEEPSLSQDHRQHHNPLDHHLAKRFIWTLTQEPYFYDKYGEEGGDGGRVGGPLGMARMDSAQSMNPEMLLPQALPLRNPAASSSSLHKRLYPRFYQAYVSKHPSYNRVASPVGEHKRFPPFHPLARFRGLSPGGSSPPYRHDYAFADHPGHRLPTAPNAQPSFKYDSPMVEDEEEEQDEDVEDEKPVRVGELLHLLKSIAGDRGLSGHTKSFRFGISRRK